MLVNDTLPQRTALSEVLIASARAVQAVRSGKSLSDAVAVTPGHLRAATQAISFHVMRRLGLATEIKNSLIKRTPPNPLFDALLQVSFALLDTAIHAAEQSEKVDAHVPVYTVHTLVDQAVQAAAQTTGMRQYKGLLNAALRRFTREREQILSQVQRKPVAKFNYPAWWIKQLQQAYPKQWEALLTAGDQPGPMTLRVNRRLASVDEVRQSFAAQGVVSEPIGPSGLLLETARPVFDLPGFAEGLWSVQDASAQKAAELLQPYDGARVLDACAAPGGKSAHLLESAQIELMALDNDAHRLARVSENLERLRLMGNNVQLACADAQNLEAWWDGRPFDFVLADVPCTASGVVRRHPDIRWLRRESDIAKTAALQQAIIKALWRTVKPGGRLLYATCSIFPQEGEKQARRFQDMLADGERLSAPGQILPLPDPDGRARYDGFFYALFAKRMVDDEHDGI